MKIALGSYINGFHNSHIHLSLQGPISQEVNEPVIQNLNSQADHQK